VDKFQSALAVVDGRFLTHSDVWANNMMFHNQNDNCKLVDWQFTSASTPYLDITAMALINQVIGHWLSVGSSITDNYGAP
jgi:thiamine kinase-like enzyme